MRVLRHKVTKKLYAVRTLRLPTLNLYDKEHAIDLEQLLIWDQVTILRLMNHPNLPVFNWVYHTKPSLFRENVHYDPKREFSYWQAREKRVK